MLTVKNLKSGLVHVRGAGPCDWANVNHWHINYCTEASGAFRGELRLQIDNIPLSSWEPGAAEIVIEDGKVKE